MFLKHFQLHFHPFAEHTPADRLWPDERLTQGVARLHYLASAGTLGLVTGSSGVGKSALLKRFLHESPAGATCYLHLTHLSSHDLLTLLVRRLGLTPEWSKDRLLNQVLDHAARAEGALLIVLDEAHLLKPEALTDLRLLVSSALADAPPLKLLLAGQPPLLDLLRRQRDLLDRATIRHHLHPLSKPQTSAYLDFRLRAAGAAETLLDTAVKELLHDYAGGVPRQLNNLATACLLQAAVQQAPRIDERLLQQTLSEFHLP